MCLLTTQNRLKLDSVLWHSRNRAHGYCCCSPTPPDVSPTGQGVDHKQVQRELGEVDVQLKEPVSLTTGAIQISWTVSASLSLSHSRSRSLSRSRSRSLSHSSLSSLSHIDISIYLFIFIYLFLYCYLPDSLFVTLSLFPALIRPPPHTHTHTLAC